MPPSRIFQCDEVQWRPYAYRCADLPEFRRMKTPCGMSEDRTAAVPAVVAAPAPDVPAKELQARVDEAYARGRGEGEAQACEAAAAQVKQALDELARALASVASLRPKLRKEAETDLVHLAVAIARRVIRREMNVDPDALRAIAAIALERLESQEVIRARVCPAHRQALAAALEAIAPGRNIEVRADASIPFGGLVLETNRGRLDASIESQLEEIEHGLAERIG